MEDRFEVCGGGVCWEGGVGTYKRQESVLYGKLLRLYMYYPLIPNYARFWIVSLPKCGVELFVLLVTASTAIALPSLDATSSVV